MAHQGSLGNQAVDDDVRDVRGTTLRGSDGQTLGTVTDAIIDHDTMEIDYIVVDSGGWLEAGTFLLPANIVSADPDHEDGLATGASRQQIENSPQYAQKSLRSEDDWKKYEQEFKQYWEEKPVMHRKDSYRIITPPEEPTSEEASTTRESSESGSQPINAAQLFPERIGKVFSDPAPGSGKVTLRPKSVARAEDAASGVTLLKPQWWEAFENYLQVNKDEIHAKCSKCESKAA
ncbi:MAG: PRC-barrel domain-containing protein [Terriglobales bacterium]